MASSLEQGGIWKSEDWTKLWQTGDTGWDMGECDSFLGQNEAEMFGGQTRRVFVPLCGKSRDMAWLHEHGHAVIGVEIAEKAVQEFFAESKMAADVQEIDGVGKLYKSQDGKVQLYVADLFSLTQEMVGTVDVIWDSGSLSAINKPDYQKYVDLLSSFMGPHSVWYAWTLEYDPSVWPGPPQSLTEDDINKLFGSRYKIEKAEENLSSSQTIGAPQPEATTTVTEKIEKALMSSPYMNTRRYRFSAK